MIQKPNPNIQSQFYTPLIHPAYMRRKNMKKKNLRGAKSRKLTTTTPLQKWLDRNSFSQFGNF